MRPVHRSRATFLFTVTLALGVGLAGCRSAPDKPPATGKEHAIKANADASKPGEPVPYDPNMWDEGPPDSLGSFLAELDKSMRAWTNLTLTAQTQADQKKVNLLHATLSERVDKRHEELIDSLETGPPRSRAIAAGALGFSTKGNRGKVLGPLVLALSDGDPSVVQNAALSLAILQLVDTPMPPLLEVMHDHVNGQARANAAYAVRSLVEAGAESSEDVIKAARHGLIDSEPFARAQAALIVALANDAESVRHLGELLLDDNPLVIGAAMQALLAMGRGDSKLLGPTARALVNALGSIPSEMRPALLRTLVLLSGHNYAQDDKAWVEWAGRLP